MTEFIFTYSITTDFTNGLKSDQLQSEIKSNVGITSAIIRIDTYSDEVYIVLNADLTVGEKTILDGIVAAHIPIIIASSQLTYNSKNDAIVDAIYSTLATFIYPGSSQINEVISIKIIGYLESGTSYQVRLYDVSNSNTIATGSFTNTNTAINSLSSIANIPLNEAIFELQCKVTGTSVAYLNSLTFFYN